MCKFLALIRSELGLFSVLGKQLSTMEGTLLGKRQAFDVHTLQATHYFQFMEGTQTKISLKKRKSLNAICSLKVLPGLVFSL